MKHITEVLVYKNRCEVFNQHTYTQGDVGIPHIKLIFKYLFEEQSLQGKQLECKYILPNGEYSAKTVDVTEKDCVVFPIHYSVLQIAGWTTLKATLVCDSGRITLDDVLIKTKSCKLGQLNTTPQVTQAIKCEIDEIKAFTETKKKEVTNHTTQEITRVTKATDSEIARVANEGKTQVQVLKNQSNGVLPRIEKLESGKVSKSGDTMTGSFDIYNGTLKVKKKYDFDGYPSKDTSDPYNYTNSYIQKYLANNNSMYIIGDGRENARKFGIQVGHRDQSYANAVGRLDLNPLGGEVRINDNIAWHSGNFNPDSKITKVMASPGFEGISARGVSMFFSAGDEISLLSTSGNIHFNYRDVSYAGGGKAVNTYVFNNRKGKIEAGDIYSNGDKVLTKANFSGNAIIWSGSSYSCTVELPSDIQSLDDVLYLQVFGGNDCGTIDGKFLSELSDGTSVLLGYVQGSSTGIQMVVEKVNGRTFRFTQSGTGNVDDGPDQTHPINYVVVRRIK